MIVLSIQILHILLIIFLLSSIFVDSLRVKEWALTLLLFILVQFVTNYGKCGLTEIEYIFTREKYEEGFLYRLIKPVITVPEDYFNKYFYIVHITYMIILVYQLKLI